MFTKINYFCITIIGLFLISTCIASSDSNLPYKEGELLVKFAPKANGKQKTINERNQILSSLNAGEVKHSFKRVPGLTLVKLPENLKVKDALSKLKSKNEFLYVEPNYKIKLLSTIPNDTNYPQLWAMPKISAPAAWDIITGSDVVVAVLDTGIDYTHPDLSANMWVNEVELNGATNIDDDENGYIDDIRGWDFADGNNNPLDYMFHGTHVAGIIGARGNNSIGVAGVCWNVKIMNLKIFSNYNEEGFIADAISAIDYAIDKEAKIINASWGWMGDPSQALKDVIEDADASGVLFIASAGNDESNNDYDPVYPASYDCNNIIAVMATMYNDERAYYSNDGHNSVDLAAPGGYGYQSPQAILSTFPTFWTAGMDYLCSTEDICFSTDYESISGTSMAAPHVAGACALVWAANPSLTHLQVKEAILETVDQLSSLQGLCVTGGRLDVNKRSCRRPVRAAGRRKKET